MNMYSQTGSFTRITSRVSKGKLDSRAKFQNTKQRKQVPGVLYLGGRKKDNMSSSTLQNSEEKLFLNFLLSQIINQ